MTISQALLVVLICVLTGSYTWGMRGTIVGGERGAMLPGAALALALLYAGGSLPMQTAYPMAAAVGAAGMFFGGMQTYGETIGLTRDDDLFTRVYARIGLALKGAGWFGVFGGMLGLSIGMMAGRFALWETILFTALLPVVKWLGILICNTPYKPKQKKYPKIYFSRTRFERWGGMLFVLLYILAFSLVKHIWLSVLLAGFGFVFGAVGFAFGNFIQNAVDKHLPQSLFSGWKAMECILGGFGGLGLSLCWCLFYAKEWRLYVFEITAHSGAWSPFAQNLENLLAFVWLALLALYAARYLAAKESKAAKFFARTEDIVIWPVFCYVPLFLAFCGNEFFSALYSSAGLLFVVAEKVSYGSSRYERVPLAKALQGVLMGGTAAVLALQLFFEVTFSAYALWLLWMLSYLAVELFVSFNPIALLRDSGSEGSFRKALRKRGSSRTWMAYASACVIALAILGSVYFKA